MCPVNLSLCPSPRVLACLGEWALSKHMDGQSQWESKRTEEAKAARTVLQSGWENLELNASDRCDRPMWVTSLHIWSTQAPQALRQQPATKLNHFSRYGFVGSKPGMPSLLNLDKVIKHIVKRRAVHSAFVNWHMTTVVNRQDKAWHAHSLQQKVLICSASWQLHRFQSLAFALSHRARALSMGKIWSSRGRYL